MSILACRAALSALILVWRSSFSCAESCNTSTFCCRTWNCEMDALDGAIRARNGSTDLRRRSRRRHRAKGGFSSCWRKLKSQDGGRCLRRSLSRRNSAGHCPGTRIGPPTYRRSIRHRSRHFPSHLIRCAISCRPFLTLYFSGSTRVSITAAMFGYCLSSTLTDICAISCLTLLTYNIAFLSSVEHFARYMVGKQPTVISLNKIRESMTTMFSRLKIMFPIVDFQVMATFHRPRRAKGERNWHDSSERNKNDVLPYRRTTPYSELNSVTIVREIAGYHHSLNWRRWRRDANTI